MSRIDEALARWKPEPANHTPMRTLVLDIETAPSEVAVWSAWKQNVSLAQVDQPGYMMCWAAKWVGTKTVKFASTFHDGHQAMLDQLHALLDEADAVITYNGVGFDLPIVEWEFMKAEMYPPSPWYDIDLLKSQRKSRKFSNKLDFVVRELGIEDGKLDTGGWALWNACRRDGGCPKAWAKMRRYNKQDVRLTEALYWRTLPYLRNHPSPAMFLDVDNQDRCGYCGGPNLVEAGFDVKRTVKYAAFQCSDCGGWNRFRTGDRAKPNVRTVY